MVTLCVSLVGSEGCLCRPYISLLAAWIVRIDQKDVSGRYYKHVEKHVVLLAGIRPAIQAGEPPYRLESQLIDR